MYMKEMTKGRLGNEKLLDINTWRVYRCAALTTVGYGSRRLEQWSIDSFMHFYDFIRYSFFNSVNGLDLDAR